MSPWSGSTRSGAAQNAAMETASAIGAVEPARCGVCGCAAVAIDEVAFGGPMLLGECPRCRHRFTVRLCDPQTRARARRVRRSTRERARAA